MARTSPRQTHARRGPEPKNAAALAGWLLLLLAVPRVIRLLYPEVWVEDDFYLESAYLVSIGMRPYLDFVHPHMPLLEWFAGLYIRLFGASHVRIEILNELAIYFTSLLTFKLAARAAGRRAAVCAAILYAFSSLVFRYHVYERECFVAPLVLLAVLAAIGSMSAPRRAVAIAVLLFAACAVKLTAAIPAAVILLYLAIARRRVLQAFLTGVLLTVLLALLSAFLYWRFGFQFIFQVFLFHFLKGRDLSATPATFPAQVLDLLAPLFVLGCIAAGAAVRRLNAVLWLVLAMVAANYLFFAVLSPTAWAHNYLEPLPYIAIISGLGLERIVAALSAVVTAERAGSAEWRWLIGGPVLIVAGLLSVTPLVNQNWLHSSVYGFGYVPRAEINRLATAIDANSAPAQRVIAPAFLCFQAHRVEFSRYPETYGVMRAAEARVRREGFFKARAALGGAGFFELIQSTAHYWADPMRAAIAKGTVPVVILDSPWQMLAIVGPPTGIAPRFLSAHGYQPIVETEHFILWKHTGRPESLPPG